MNYNQISKKEQSTRLQLSQRKLERLKTELFKAYQQHSELFKLSNGQPMNDKRNGHQFFKKVERIESKIDRLNHEIKEQEKKVEKEETRIFNKENGLNRNGNGLKLAIDNIDNLKKEIAKYESGNSFYTASTIRKYKKAVKDLEKQLSIAKQENVQLDKLVSNGTLNQWKKQPTIYFVKELRKVAIQRLENGSFIIASKYSPKTDKESEVVECILNQLA